MLTAGVFLFVVGPVINRLTSFKIGPIETILDPLDLFVVGQEIAGAEVQLAAGGSHEVAARARATGTGVLTSVEVTEGASEVIEQLSDDDKVAVQSVIEQMTSLEDHGGVQLPGSTLYSVREVSDDVRLVYRPLNEATGPPGYAILNVARPGSTLWRMTDNVL